MIVYQVYENLFRDFNVINNIDLTNFVNAIFCWRIYQDKKPYSKMKLEKEIAEYVDRAHPGVSNAPLSVRFSPQRSEHETLERRSSSPIKSTIIL